MYSATALCVACQNGHAQIVKTLIDNGADVNHQTQVGILRVCPHAPVQWQCFFRILSGLLCTLQVITIKQMSWNCSSTMALTLML